MYQLTCAGGTYFDYILKACAPSSTAACFGTTTTTTTRALCTDAQDLTGVATDCTKFLRCVYGKFYELSCPAGQNFDYVRKVCDAPSSVTCLGTITTTTITTTT